MSQHKTGTARNQMSFGSLDDQIGTENPVRIIDAFVDMLDLKTLGFQHVKPKQKGAPSYPLAPCVPRFPLNSNAAPAGLQPALLRLYFKIQIQSVHNQEFVFKVSKEFEL